MKWVKRIFLGLMSRMGEFRFTHMTDGEIEALHAYLQQADLPLAH